MRRKREERFPENGFEQWNGYMNAKITKLDDQFIDKALNEENKVSDIFKGISIFVNGYTKPSADQLKCLMSEHGGIYHHYFRPQKTSFIIASNLPDTKVKNLPSTKIIKPEWISDSIQSGLLLDYKNYILYSNTSKTQPRINFKNNSTTSIENDIENKDKNTNVKMRSAVDPKFLSEFYNNSRLHHISQMGTAFKDYVNELRNSSDFAFPLRDNLKKHSNKSYLQDDSKAIMHIDMDCFFVSVGLRKHPHLRGQPVAVTHAKNTGNSERQNTKGVDRKLEFDLYKEKRMRNLKMTTSDKIELNTKVDQLSKEDKFSSMSEIASCSYEARAKGLRNGMFMGPALNLCPDLKTIPYDFDGYKEVAYTLYDTVAQYTLDIEAVSCDEMYVDCTELLKVVGLTPMEFSSLLRDEIRKKTDCPCSVGFGENRLQARMATKKAKPDGQYHLLNEDAEVYFEDIPLSDLPGVGYQMQYKLKSLGYITCGSLRSINLTKLQKNFGNKTGQLLYKYCRGQDDRSLNFTTVRKSISKNVNYGIRFEDNDQYETFLKQVCQEVHSEMLHHNVVGKTITLKLMVRAANAPVETAKFMGHGVCDNITRATNIPEATDNLDIMIVEVMKISRKLNIEPSEIRGVSIQISKLENINDKVIDRSKGIQKFFDNTAKKTQNDNTKNNGNETVPNEEQEKLIVEQTVKPENKTIKQLGMRRRGRPPKNLYNSKIVPKLRDEFKNDFFKSSNSKPTNTQYDISDLDEDVLMESPDDIRQEIISACKLKESPKKYVNKLKNKIETISPNNQEYNDNTNISLVQNSPDYILNLQCKDICNMINVWMQSRPGPLNCDIKLVNLYLQNLVTEKKIEDVQFLINFVYKDISKLNDCDWHKVFRSMVLCVQESMLIVYGKRMAIFHRFTCCSENI